MLYSDAAVVGIADDVDRPPQGDDFTAHAECQAQISGQLLTMRSIALDRTVGIRVSHLAPLLGTPWVVSLFRAPGVSDVVDEVV